MRIKPAILAIRSILDHKSQGTKVTFFSSANMQSLQIEATWRTCDPPLWTRGNWIQQGKLARVGRVLADTCSTIETRLTRMKLRTISSLESLQNGNYGSVNTLLTAIANVIITGHVHTRDTFDSVLISY